MTKKRIPRTDPRRRRLLRAGVGMAGLPLLHACGGGSGGDDGGGGGGTPPPAASCTPPATTPSSPRGLHASFTGDPTSTRTLTWFTDGLDDPGTTIEYGPVSADMTPDRIACDPFPGRVSGSAHQAHGVDVLTHAATMTGLTPDVPIRYRVGADGAWSDVRVLPPTPSGDFRFCHFGDHGSKEASLAVLDGVRALDPDFLIIAGDLSYANGEQPEWDTWFDRLDPYASRLPVMTAPGNHEEEDNGGAAYKSRVSQPGKGFRYAFDYGNVHFVFSTGGSLLGSNVGQDLDLVAELAWLEADLATAALRRARGEIDFIILVQHYTIWTDQEGREPANPSLVLLEEDKLLRYGVDLALVGHDHIYQRSVPMGRGLPRDSGYIQVTGGAGGVGLRGFAPISEWSASDAIRYCFTEYVVDGPKLTAVTWAVDRPDNTLAGGELTEIDRFELDAREPLLSALHADTAPVDTREQADMEAVIRHTRERNALHDSLEAISRRR